MNRIAAVLGAIITIFAISGCQDNSSQELIRVADELPDGQFKNIDLTRNDAVYFIDPNLNTQGLEITCPNLMTVSFSEYVLERITPTGVNYDPSSQGLRLSSGEALPQEADPRISQLGFNCYTLCVDAGGDGEEFCLVQGSSCAPSEPPSRPSE